MRVIVVGNEKGGAGKSTVATHLAVALVHEGARVGLLDLDRRQRSTERFLANRRRWVEARVVDLPNPVELAATDDSSCLDKATSALEYDFLVIDTPGADTVLARLAHRRADLVVTPMNDSFVDFDVLGIVDPVTLELVRPGLYSEAVWEARKARAADGGRSIDWVVLRNRLSSSDPRNRRRVDERVQALSRRVGFRPISGLRDRVIYRELFPYGLTVADLRPGVRPGPISLGHIAARQELRVMMADLGLVDQGGGLDRRASQPYFSRDSHGRAASRRAVQASLASDSVNPLNVAR
jgi:chromosome partitioning protein